MAVPFFPFQEKSTLSPFEAQQVPRGKILEAVDRDSRRVRGPRRRRRGAPAFVVTRNLLRGERGLFLSSRVPRSSERPIHAGTLRGVVSAVESHGPRRSCRRCAPVRLTGSRTPFVSTAVGAPVAEGSRRARRSRFKR